MKEPKRVSIVTDTELWESVKEKASEIGVSVSMVIRWLLMGWLKGDVKLQPPTDDETEP